MQSAPKWWPDDLGSPSTQGGQNDTHYAFFPAKRRLAIQSAGKVTLYDSGDLTITGVSQQQSGTGSLAFSGPGGEVRLDQLKPV